MNKPQTCDNVLAHTVWIWNDSMELNDVGVPQWFQDLHLQIAEHTYVNVLNVSTANCSMAYELFLEATL